ncbi:MAG: response regulator [Lentisphaeraceae bacterium]|nr:response regulator [Lentisphaeraceae bacterium]
MKVLLIDDSSTMRKIQKRALGELGIVDIDEAANGELGLNQLIAMDYEYDLVMLDMNMPQMGGLEVLTKVRADGNSKNINIIMCTSVADKDDVIGALKAGATNYLTKPFTPQKLKKTIEKYMN